jgi:hypothetical protein
MNRSSSARARGAGLPDVGLLLAATGGAGRALDDLSGGTGPAGRDVQRAVVPVGDRLRLDRRSRTAARGDPDDEQDECDADDPHDG